MKVERKIASSDTTKVRNVNGNGSICQAAGMNGKVNTAIQIPNHATWMYTNAIDPTKRLMESARRSVRERSASADFSSWATISTLRLVSSSSEVCTSLLN